MHPVVAWRAPAHPGRGDSGALTTARMTARSMLTPSASGALLSTSNGHHDGHHAGQGQPLVQLPRQLCALRVHRATHPQSRLPCAQLGFLRPPVDPSLTPGSVVAVDAALVRGGVGPVCALTLGGDRGLGSHDHAPVAAGSLSGASNVRRREGVRAMESAIVAIDLRGAGARRRPRRRTTACLRRHRGGTQPEGCRGWWSQPTRIPLPREAAAEPGLNRM
jgi:hypothetical protein